MTYKPSRKCPRCKLPTSRADGLCAYCESIVAHAPAPRGRPRSSTRTAKFQIRCTPEELQALRLAASLSDRDFSDWARHTLRTAAAAALHTATR